MPSGIPSGSSMVSSTDRSRSPRTVTTGRIGGAVAGGDEVLEDLVGLRLGVAQLGGDVLDGAGHVGDRGACFGGELARAGGQVVLGEERSDGVAGLGGDQVGGARVVSVDQRTGPASSLPPRWTSETASRVMVMPLRQTWTSMRGVRL